jgi:hypothetical protein
MGIWTAAQLPKELTIRLCDRHLVDAGMAVRHKSVCGKKPVFVAIGAEPLSAVVAILIGIPHCDPVVSGGPQLLDEPVFVFLIPLAGDERLGFCTIFREFNPVTPTRMKGVGECNFCRISRVGGRGGVEAATLAL